MRISYSNHARKRMRERNVSEEDVEYVLGGRRPVHPSRRKRTLRARTRGGVRLEVVYTEESRQGFRIVTVKRLDR